MRTSSVDGGTREFINNYYFNSIILIGILFALLLDNLEYLSREIIFVFVFLIFTFVYTREIISATRIVN